MMKRRFVGLGRKPKRRSINEKKLELPDNFILGFTNQQTDTTKTVSKKEKDH